MIWFVRPFIPSADCSGPANQLLNLVAYIFFKLKKYIELKLFAVIRQHLLTGKLQQTATAAFNLRTWIALLDLEIIDISNHLIISITVLK